MHHRRVPAVAVLGQVVVVELTRALALEVLVLVLEAGPVAHLLELGRVVRRVKVGRA